MKRPLTALIGLFSLALAGLFLIAWLNGGEINPSIYPAISIYLLIGAANAFRLAQIDLDEDNS